jgi:hypothetical protein
MAAFSLRFRFGLRRNGLPRRRIEIQTAAQFRAQSGRNEKLQGKQCGDDQFRRSHRRD